MDGDLIGVNSFILSRSGTSSGVGFAIPAPVVRRVVETAMNGGRAVVRPWVGARLQTVTPEIAKTLGLARPAGALVSDVWPGGAAEQAGLKQGDVVTSVDGGPVVDAAALNYAVATHRPGETLRIGVRRTGGDQQLTLRAEAPPATPARDEKVVSGANPFEGATVVNLSPAVAEELGLDPFGGQGVLISKISAGAAQRAGLRPGDLIRSVNGRPIQSVRDLTGAVAVRAAVWQVTIERNGQQVTATFRA
jgi:S1-C subfamily serine protease